MEELERLAKFDLMVKKVLKEQKELSTELQKLRENHQEKTYQFRELMGRKLINSSIINLLQENSLLKEK